MDASKWNSRPSAYKARSITRPSVVKARDDVGLPAGFHNFMRVCFGLADVTARSTLHLSILVEVEGASSA